MYLLGGEFLSLYRSPESTSAWEVEWEHPAVRLFMYPYHQAHKRGAKCLFMVAGSPGKNRRRDRRRVLTARGRPRLGCGPPASSHHRLHRWVSSPPNRTPSPGIPAPPCLFSTPTKSMSNTCRTDRNLSLPSHGSGMVGRSGDRHYCRRSYHCRDLTSAPWLDSRRRRIECWPWGVASPCSIMVSVWGHQWRNAEEWSGEGAMAFWSHGEKKKMMWGGCRWWVQAARSLSVLWGE